MMKIKIILLVVCHALCVNVFAGEDSLRTKPLGIGGTLPNFPVGKSTSHDLADTYTRDYSDKLLIVDFWDTFCGACIASMPKLDSLQGLFGDQIQILSVTYQKEDIVRKFIQKNHIGRNYSLPLIIEDTAWRSLFPHQLLPHVVWIHKGVVKAITSSGYVTKANIQSVLDGSAIELPVKDDFVEFDYNAPFDCNASLLKITLDGFKPNAETKWGIVRDSVQGYSRYYFVNYEIPKLYDVLWYQITPKDFPFLPNRVSIETEKQRFEQFQYDKAYGSRDQWIQEHNVSLEVVLSDGYSKTQPWRRIVDLLDATLGVKGRYEKRNTACLVLKRSRKKKSDQNQTLLSGKEMRMKDIKFMFDYQKTYPPVIDETGFAGKITIPSWDNDLDKLRTSLRYYGFDLIREEREVEILVIRDR